MPTLNNGTEVEMVQDKTLAELIAQSGAWLDEGRSGTLREAKRNRAASTLLASHFRAFERIKKRLFKGSLSISELDPVEACIVEALQGCDLVLQTEEGILRAHTPQARRFITGGWLEEVACLAALEAGADEVRYGQSVRWKIDGYEGENEIDVIARFGQRLAFYSCKAFGAGYQRSNDRRRKKLMEALHEADNLADHFGSQNSFVGLILTTDLYDNYNGKPKYEALFGKARALNVQLITLDDMKWDRLVKAMAQAKQN